MANTCWYCRKGGIVDLYFAGRVGACPKCGKGVNVVFDVERFITLDNITTSVDEWVKSTNGGTQREYKVGDRVISEEGNVRGYEDKVGVITEIDVTYEYPYLIDFGSQEIWCKVKCFADDKPLTNKELEQMDGQKVWCSVVTNGGEDFSRLSTVGWYTVNVKKRWLEKGKGHYNFAHNGVEYGFRAYRTDQSHRAN